MIHSIIDPADIFREDEGYPEIVTERAGSGFKEYSVINGRRTLRRLISTNPRDFLDNRL